MGNNTHGTRIIQKLLDLMSNKDAAVIKHFLKPNVLTLSKNPNGLHIIIKALLKFSYLDNDYIYETVNAYFKSMSVDRYSCCVVQKCLELPINQYVEKLIELVIENAYDLCVDEYGSYVVLKVIQTKPSQVQKKMIEKLLSNINLTCSTKNSIQILEKSLEFIKGRLLKDLIYYLLSIETVTIMANNSSGLFSKYFSFLIF